MLGSSCLVHWTLNEERRTMNHERDYSEIRATVADVALFNFPHARVDLMITSSTNPQILDLSKRPQTLTADNYFWTSLGKVDCGDTRNIGSGRGLLPIARR